MAVHLIISLMPAFARVFFQIDDRIWSTDVRRSGSLTSLNRYVNVKITMLLHGPMIGQRIASSFVEEYLKMPLLNLVVALIVVGMALWLVNRYIPMASSIKTILNVVVVVAVGVFVLKSVGLWGDVTSFRVGR